MFFLFFSQPTLNNFYLFAWFFFFFFYFFLLSFKCMSFFNPLVKTRKTFLLLWFLVLKFPLFRFILRPFVETLLSEIFLLISVHVAPCLLHHFHHLFRIKLWVVFFYLFASNLAEVNEGRQRSLWSNPNLWCFPSVFVFII
jgi:hypothetical protein